MGISASSMEWVARGLDIHQTCGGSSCSGSKRRLGVNVVVGLQYAEHLSLSADAGLRGGFRNRVSIAIWTG